MYRFSKQVVLIAFALLLLTSAVFAQSGSIAGRVFDEATGEPLPGANVYLEGTNYGSSTDLGGAFRIVGVRSGDYTLIVSYLGYEEHSESVDVYRGETTKLTIRMTSSYVEGEEVVFVGAQAAGQAKALNQQRTAETIKNIVAADQIGQFPDPNVAEALQRIPGIGTQRDQGEGRYIIIRGTEPNLNSVFINGNRVPSPEGDVRSVALDVIPADQLASIEVTKALTPDMDGDAIGGAVNLRTKSALDYDKPRMGIDIAGGMNGLTGGGIGRGAFNYARRIGEDNNIGIQFSGSHYVTARGSDNHEMEYDDAEMEDTGAERTVLKTLELRDYSVTRTRTSFGTTIDYMWSEKSRSWFRFLWNEFGDQEHRRRLEFKIDDGDYYSDNHVEGATVEKELKNRFEVQRIYNYAIGNEMTMMDDRVELDFGISYSYAEEEEPNRLDHVNVFQWNDGGELNDEVNLTWNRNDPDVPQVNPGEGFTAAQFDDVRNWYLDEVVYEDNITTDTETAFTLNSKYNTFLAGYPAYLKAGYKMRYKTKDQRAYAIEYGPEQVIPMDEFDENFDTNDFLGGDYSQWDVGLLGDPEEVRDYWETYRYNEDFFEAEEDVEGNDGDTYNASEKVNAGYLMGAAEFGDLMVLGGARVEMTDILYNANRVIFDVEGDYDRTEGVQGEKSYTNVLPSVHFRYRVTPKTNVRAAYTHSLARPQYFDIAPYELVIREDNEIEMGNPDLDAALAQNIDILGEHYFQSIGVVSAGFFYKSVANYMYPRVFEISRDYGGGLEDYEVTMPVNAEDENATLMGAEIAWSQRFGFLPGWLGGFGIYANYTWTDSEIELLTEEGEPARTAQLPGQADMMTNVALSYEKYGFSARLGLNITGEHILEVGESEEEDHFLAQHMQLDFSAAYRIIPGLQVYTEMINLTNEPYVVFQGDENFPIQREFYSWWGHIGLKYQF